MNSRHSTRSELSTSEDKPDPQSFFQETHRSFERAQKTHPGLTDSFFKLGGCTIRLLFASPKLGPLLSPALDHLKTAPSRAPSLTICCWDSVSTGTPLPLLPWADKHYVAQREIPYLWDKGLHVSFSRDSGVLSALNSRLNLALFWIQDADQIPFYETAAPFRSIFQWWARTHRLMMVHSGAVGVGDRGILLAGRGGSGKSTTSLLSFREGMAFAGDDYVILSQEPPYRVHSLYNSVKIDSAALSRMPELDGRVYNQERRSEKNVIFLKPAFPDRLFSGFRVDAFLLPQISGSARTEITGASSSEAFKALVPSTVFQQAGAREATIKLLSRMVQKIPSFHLLLGSDFPSIPGVIRDFLVRIRNDT